MSPPIDPALLELEEELSGWRSELLCTKNGPKALLANALTALRKAPEWNGVLAYNEFNMASYAMRPPPWHAANVPWKPQRWTDRDDTLTANWLQHEGIAVTPAITATAVEAVARDRAFHPVRDYLASLQWDGRKRIENFAAALLGAENTLYTRAVSRCMFLAAVARIRDPGCKVDHVVILEGPQGIGKSTALNALFHPWFSDELAELGTKDASMQMAGIWCIEIAELSAMNRSDGERVKAFISRRTDRFRPAYGRRVIEAPRQAIIAGTTNAEAYLKDETGARRFWPIRCSKIDLDDIRTQRDQLWAEAVVLHESGEAWWFTDPETIAAAREEQDARYVTDPWERPIVEYLRNREDATIEDLLNHAVLVDRSRQSNADQQRVGRILKRIGWQRRRTGPRDKRRWQYFPPSSQAPK